jgi:putative transposase
VKLGSYVMFQRDPEHDSRLWQELMSGLSTRQDGRSVRRFDEAYGIEKSVVSEQLIETSRGKQKQLKERPLQDLKLSAVMTNGIAFDSDLFVVALGTGKDGAKTVLGLRQERSENAEVVAICAPIWSSAAWISASGGCTFWTAPAPTAAVKKKAGDAAFIQRCQLHKRRNVLRHLPNERQPLLEQKLTAAWNMSSYSEARRALEQVQSELERINPSAARSLAEGMEETLTIHRLGVPEKTTPNAVLHQPDRIGPLGRGREMWSREEVAGRGYEATLGRQWIAVC